MKITLSILLSLLIGFAAGWFSFRAKYMTYFHGIIEKANLTEEQLIEGYKVLPQITQNIEQDDRMATAISLAALKRLEMGRAEEAMQLLAQTPASYFVIYGPPDHPEKKMTEERLSTLHAIEKARSESSVLDEAIKKSLKNINQ